MDKESTETFTSAVLTACHAPDSRAACYNMGRYPTPDGRCPPDAAEPTEGEFIDPDRKTAERSEERVWTCGELFLALKPRSQLLEVDDGADVDPTKSDVDVKEPKGSEMYTTVGALTEVATLPGWQDDYEIVGAGALSRMMTLITAQYVEVVVLSTADHCSGAYPLFHSFVILQYHGIADEPETCTATCKTSWRSWIRLYRHQKTKPTTIIAPLGHPSTSRQTAPPNRTYANQDSRSMSMILVRATFG